MDTCMQLLLTGRIAFCFCTFSLRWIVNGLYGWTHRVVFDGRFVGEFCVNFSLF